jgi:hypothetical protein
VQQNGTAIHPPAASQNRRLTFILLMWRIGRPPNSIPLYSYIQQDARLHSLFISGNCSTCFGWYFNPSSGAHATVSTAFGICHTVTSICRSRGRVGTGLSVLWVAYANHSTLKPVPKYNPKSQYIFFFFFLLIALLRALLLLLCFAKAVYVSAKDSFYQTFLYIT